MPEESKDISAGLLDTEKLKALFDESSRTNRNLLLSFLVVAVYILITIGAVTDRQILIPDSKVMLPLLNVGIGLFGFFVIAPLILVIVHFDVLFNLYQHTRKLRRWVKVRGLEDEVEYYPFLYNFAVTTKAHWTIRGPLRVATAFLYCYFPLFVLIYTQVKFAKYHSVEMSAWHCLLVAVDVLLLFVYWVKLRREGMEADDKEKIRWWNWRGLFKLSNSLTYLTVATLLVVSVFNFAIVSMIVAGEYRKTAIYMFSRELSGRLETVIYTIFEKESQTEMIAADFRSPTIATDYVGPKREGLYSVADIIDNYFFPRIILRGETLMAETPSDTIIQHYLNKYKDAAEAVEQANMDFARGINLKGRDLKYADFVSTNMMMAALSKADFEGADLSLAKLQGANFFGAQLQGVSLTSAQLQGAELRKAVLKDANLSLAQLQNADLRLVNLQDATMVAANLKGANVASAQLQLTDLRLAILKGANLANAQLQVSELSEAQLQGAILFNAKFDCAVVTGILTDGVFIGGSGFSNKAEFDWELLESIIDSRSKYILDAARKECGKAKPKPFEGHRNDIKGYFNFHKELACESSDYAKGNFKHNINFLKDKIDAQIYKRQLAELMVYLQNNCPSALEYIKDLN